jgi:hypothetical protein
MTSTSTNQQKPPKYILDANGQSLTTYDERPTMEFIKTSCGEGVHILYNGEGKVLRRFTVDTNRNSNLRIVGENPLGLEGLSTLNLERLVKQYIRIVKIWPAKASDAKALQKELARREFLLEDALSATELSVSS